MFIVYKLSPSAFLQIYILMPVSTNILENIYYLPPISQYKIFSIFEHTQKGKYKQATSQFTYDGKHLSKQYFIKVIIYQVITFYPLFYKILLMEILLFLR